MISAAEEIRLRSLDRVLDDLEPNSTLAGELFAVVDAIGGQPTLRRTLTDPGLPADQRRSVARQVLQGKVSEAAVKVTEEAAALRWAGGRTFAAAIERQGVRAELRAAQQNGQLDDVEDELFRFDRAVVGGRELSAALHNDRVALPARVGLVTGLLDGKAHEATVVLARRAVSAREGSFSETVQVYLACAAELRHRGLATVRVALPLTAEQRTRLQAALSLQVGREVAMHIIVDPDILGGVHIELGDEVIEGTVAGRLERARREIQ